MHSQIENILVKLKKYARQTFYLDLRSIGLFRIALGTVAIPYLVFLWTQSQVFFGANGLLKTERAWQLSVSAPIFSVLYWTDNPWMLHAVFLTLLVSTFFYLIGFRSSWFALLIWFLLCCLRARNPYPWHAGDFLIRLSFFWSIFLPVSERFSIGRKINKLQSNYYLSAASIVIFFQFFIEYFIAGLAKIGPIWPAGLGIYYSLQMSMFQTSFGSYLSSADLGWLKGLNYLTLFTELFVPFLLFVPNKKGLTRATFFSFFFVFHVFILFFMNLDVFPFACFAFLMILLPSTFWDKRPLDVHEVKPRAITKAKTVFLCSIMAFILFANFFGLYFHLRNDKSAPIVQKVKAIEIKLGIDQEWKLFSFGRLNPLNFWFQFRGQTKDGKFIDVFRDGKKPLENAPEHPKDGFRNVIWAKYLQSMERGYIQFAGYSLARYLCQEWNKSHPGYEVIDVEATLMYQQMPSPRAEDNLPPPFKSSYARVSCESGEPIPPTKE